MRFTQFIVGITEFSEYLLCCMLQQCVSALVFIALWDYNTSYLLCNKEKMAHFNLKE